MDKIPKIEPDDDYPTQAGEELEIKQELLCFDNMVTDNSSNMKNREPDDAEQTPHEFLIDAVKVEEDITFGDLELDPMLSLSDQIALEVTETRLHEQTVATADALDSNLGFTGKTCDRKNLPVSHGVLIKDEDLSTEECSSVSHMIMEKPSSFMYDGKKDVGSQLKEDLIQREKIYSCPHCKFTTKLKTYMTKHLHVHTKNKEEIFPCTLCSYETKFPSNLTLHMQVHNKKNKKPFVCLQCNYQTDVADDFGMHLQLHDINQSKTFKCPLCDFKTFAKAEMKQHNLIHFPNPQKVYTCEICNYSSVVGYVFLKHMRIHDADREKEFTCNHCSYRTDIKASLAIHIANHDAARPKQHLCLHCNFKTYDKSNLRQHVLKHFEYSVRRYACPHCNYRADHKQQFAIHLRKHDGEFVPVKHHMCTYCPYRTANKSHLTRHLRKHDKNRSKPFSCHLCNYATDDNLYLTIHMRRHDKYRKKTLACSHCDYQTDYKRTLQRHLLKNHQTDFGTAFPWTLCNDKTDTETDTVYTPESDCMHIDDTDSMDTIETDSVHTPEAVHTDDTDSMRTLETDSVHTDDTDSRHTPESESMQTFKKKHDMFFSCPHCAYTSVDKLKMECHMNTHEQEIQPLHCDFCGYRSHDRKTFAAHVHCHSENQLQQFVCELCDYSTARKSHLTRHILTHATDNFRCSCCLYSTNNEFNFVNHLARHKNKQEILARSRCSAKLYKGVNFGYQKTHDQASLLRQQQKLDNAAKQRKDRSGFLDKTPRFSCEACNYTTDYRPCIIKHFRSHSSNKQGNSFECPVCLYKAPAQGSLLLHMAQHHIVENHVVTTKPKKSDNFVEIKVEVVDDGAGKDISDVSSMMRDGSVDCIVVDSVAGDIIYVNVLGKEAVNNRVTDTYGNCTIAGIDRDVVADVDDLVNRKDEETVFLFSCNKCAYKTGNLNAFARHNSKHEAAEQKDFACMDCDFQTDKKHDLALHIRKHMSGRKQRKPQRKRSAVLVC